MGLWRLPLVIGKPLKACPSLPPSHTAKTQIISWDQLSRLSELCALSIKDQEACLRSGRCSIGVQHVPIHHPWKLGNVILPPGERELLIQEADMVTEEDMIVPLGSHTFARSLKERRRLDLHGKYPVIYWK
jgi:hypothetical protein